MTVGRFAPVTTSFFQQYEWLLTPPKRTKLIASTDRQKTTLYSYR